jgi:hypothetical protein
MNACSEIHRFRPPYGTSAMKETKASGREPELTAEQAAERQRARDWTLARHKIIDGMIHNNQMQLRNECARGGAEIELECALRDTARAGAGAEAQAELERVTAHLQALRAEHQRLVAEREWLNASLLEFENGPSAGERQRSGHA